MKIFAITSWFLTISVLLSAQPQVTRAHFFSPGDVIFLVDVPIIPDAGPAGADVVWNFSTVTADPEVFSQAAALADTTPYFNDYPQANIALYTDALGTEIYQYMLLEDDAFEQLGTVIAGFQSEIFQDPETFLVFPFTYNSQWQDNFASTSSFDVNPTVTTSEGSLEAVVDAYGTVILPHATFTDALRVRIVTNSTDSTDLGLGVTEKNVNRDTSYHWISPSYYGPLCSRSKLIQEHYAYLITPDTVLVDVEILNEASFTYDPMSGGSAVRNIEPGKYSLHIAPNPFEKTVTVSFTNEYPGEMEFLLRDLQGNLIMSETLMAQPGNNNLRLTLPDMPAGSYIALLHSAQGADIQKLVRIGSSR